MVSVKSYVKSDSVIYYQKGDFMDVIVILIVEFMCQLKLGHYETIESTEWSFHSGIRLLSNEYTQCHGWDEVYA